MLHGHERAITQIKYNREGDLLFSSSKDNKPNVWYSLNGERLGTFNGHQGAVWCIDVDWTTSRFLSGAGDNTLKVWDCETGKEIGNISTNSSVRTCLFSYSGNMAVYTTDRAMRHQCEIFINRRSERRREYITRRPHFANTDQGVEGVVHLVGQSRRDDHHGAREWGFGQVGPQGRWQDMVSGSYWVVQNGCG
jgi:hypothetical protein